MNMLTTKQIDNAADELDRQAEVESAQRFPMHVYYCALNNEDYLIEVHECGNRVMFECSFCGNFHDYCEEDEAAMVLTEWRGTLS